MSVGSSMDSERLTSHVFAKNSTESPVGSLLLKQFSEDNTNHSITHDFVLSITICLSLFLLFLVLFFVCLCYNDVKWQGCLRKNKNDVEETIRKSMRRQESTMKDKSIKKSKRSSQMVSLREKSASIIRPQSTIIKKNRLSQKAPPQRHTVYEFCNFEIGNEPIQNVWTIEGERTIKTKSCMIPGPENFRASRRISYDETAGSRPELLSRMYSSPDGRMPRPHSTFNLETSSSMNDFARRRRASSFEGREAHRSFHSELDNWLDPDHRLSQSVVSFEDEHEDGINIPPRTNYRRVSFSGVGSGFSGVVDSSDGGGGISVIISSEDNGVSQILRTRHTGDYTEVHSSSNNGFTSSRDISEGFSVTVTRSDLEEAKTHPFNEIPLKDFVSESRLQNASPKIALKIPSNIQRRDAPMSSPKKLRPLDGFKSNVNIDVGETIIEESALDESEAAPDTA